MSAAGDAGVRAGTEPIEPLRVSAEAPDLDADVVVVGAGIAGVCAALEASAAGAEVVVLDRGGGVGGTSALSGGIIYLGGGTPVQVACGFDDDPEQMATFLLAACGPGADEAKVRAYCDGSVGHFHWLVDRGVPFRAAFCDEPNREPFGDEGLLFSGGEDTWPFCELTPPVPRGHCPQFPDTAGGFLMGRLGEALAATDVRVVTDARVDRLVIDPEDGDRVVGARARIDGEHRVVGARRGLVLAGGGFIYDDAMVERWCPQARRAHPAWRVGTDADDGSAIRLGQGVGAAVARMDAVECALPIGPPHRMARCILVNGDGERFVNEDAYTGRIGLQALVDQGGEVFMIVDEEIFEVNFVGMRYQWAAGTAEELAVEVGLPPERLAATLAEYNRHAERGEDPEHHKLPPWVVPLRPPYGAVDLRASSKTIYATFTLGGLATDPDARVRGEAGGHVPGLWAAGRTTAGLAAYGYASGVSLGDGSFFGRAAGRGAAAG